MGKIQCYTCGGMAELIGDNVKTDCPYCGCIVEVKRISSLNYLEIGDIKTLKQTFDKSEGIDNTSLSLALCYLKMGNYTLAKKKLEEQININPECSEGYYYYAITLLNNRDISTISMKEAKQITEYLQTASALNEDFIFPRLLYALLCIEYYQANDLTSPDDGFAILTKLSEMQVDSCEYNFLKSLIQTDVI